ncbi:hypothetical protein [Calothrix sp. 336/3]|uniref:hypothetical protein n=1 Tax=Calothrix sp. 336/3 TaxID=1337936 RepID=UPI0004E442CE|nr:hypothetical protein [Calothrix sp. 336/3]AKG21527.1 hypothetical protein IJ00_09780 [Calothrix sp. 336/3]
MVIFSVPTYYSKQFLDGAAKAGGFGSCGWCSQTHPFYVATNQEIADFLNLCLLVGGLSISTWVLLVNFDSQS